MPAVSQYANTSDVPLSLAVFLATDNYDYNPDPNYLSATTLIKPVRQIILAARDTRFDAVVDLEDQLASRMGSAIHDAIERAWLTNYERAMDLLGYPQSVIDRVVVNPTPEQMKMYANLDLERIPVYLEQRASKQIGKWTVAGKFDFVGDGRLEDIKTTSTYTAMHSTMDEKYRLQGSLYRWLNPEIITADEIAIQWIFTDWSAAKAKQDPKYPQKRRQTRLVPLMSVAETDAWVRKKIALIDKYWDAPEDSIPECEADDLWRSDPVFKFYKHGDTTAARSTKNFESMQEARMYQMTEAKGAGAIKEVPGQVKACRYCAAFSLCSQKDRLVASGDLVL